MTVLSHWHRFWNSQFVYIASFKKLNWRLFLVFCLVTFEIIKKKLKKIWHDYDHAKLDDSLFMWHGMAELAFFIVYVYTQLNSQLQQLGIGNYWKWDDLLWHSLCTMVQPGLPQYIWSLTCLDLLLCLASLYVNLYWYQDSDILFINIILVVEKENR